MGSGMAMKSTSAARFGSAIVVFLAIALATGVQGRSNPQDVPTNPEFFRTLDVSGSATHINDESDSRFWASATSRNGQDAGGFVQPRGGVTAANYYDYAAEGRFTSKPSESFFTPEQLARIEAFNEAQAMSTSRQAKLDMRQIGYSEAARPVKTTSATTSSSSSSSSPREYGQHPIQVFPDGTELLWVRGPEDATPEEKAQLEAMKDKSTDAYSNGALSASYNYNP